MQTSINFKALQKLPANDQGLALKSAIDFEFSKVETLLDIAKGSAVSNVKHTNFKMAAPTRDQIKAHMALKYGTASDTPELSAITDQMETFFHSNMPEIDLGFTLLFDLIDLRSSNQTSFDILDTNAGISWSQRKPGQRTQLRKAFSEAKASVDMTEYSEGIGILDIWIEYQKFWTVDEVIAEFRSTYFDKMAAQHYGLFPALGAGINQAFDTDDTTTMNNAFASMKRNLKGKGLGSENASVYLACAPEQQGRIEKALTAQRGSAIVDQGTVNEPLTARIAGVINTTHIDSGSYYMVMPGRKNKRGVWKDLSTESQRDITASAENIVGVGRYNAAIGEQNQVKRIPLS